MATQQVTQGSSVCYVIDPRAAADKQKRIKKMIGNGVGRVDQVLPSGACSVSFPKLPRKLENGETEADESKTPNAFLLAPSNLVPSAVAASH